MSRIGEKTIEIPTGVTATFEGSKVSVNGPKGALSFLVDPRMTIEIADNKINVKIKGEAEKSKAIHGTTRQVIQNMVKGVSEGWSKTLEIVGTGFRATTTGSDLVLLLGFSHPVKIAPISGIAFAVNENKVTVTGFDKVLVGQVAANIKKIKKPDVYKGKGIRYLGEVIKLKPGKQAKVGAVGGGAKGGK